MAGSCGGVLRGQGRQHLGALFNIIAYYVLALPIGITLAFHSSTRLGLVGLWIGASRVLLRLPRRTDIDHFRNTGQVVGLFIVGIGEYCVVWLGTDWEEEVRKGIGRNRIGMLESEVRVVESSE